MKWYHSKDVIDDLTFYDNLKALIDVKYRTLDNFIFPIQLTTIDSDGQYGFLMKLIDLDRMTDLRHIGHGQKQFSSMMILLEACKNLSSAFTQLHEFEYLTFTDLNEDGIFFDVNTGEVLLCDCDNILVGNYHRALGRSELIAPELFRGDVDRPSEKTDDHSLSVILFEMIFGCHPYFGKETCDHSMNELINENYFSNPKFIFDGTSNMCIDEAVRERWDATPKNIRKSFSKDLVDGVQDPDCRVGAAAWAGIFPVAQKLLITDPFWGKLTPPKRHKRTQEVIFVIDVSSSMDGEKINTINKALKNTLDSLKKLVECGRICDIDTFISILTFDDDARWVKQNSSINDFSEKDFTIQVGKSSTRAAKAFMLLDEYLDYSKYHGKGSFSQYPLIFFISDGRSRPYLEVLEELKNNICFEKSTKVSIGLKDAKTEPDLNLMTEFVDSEEYVMVVEEIELRIADLIQAISVSYSTSRGKPDCSIIEIIQKTNQRMRGIE